MRNWDRLADEYLEQYGARGLSEGMVGNVRRELNRLGCWLKNRRPRPQLEQVGSDLLISYLRSRTAYRRRASERAGAECGHPTAGSAGRAAEADAAPVPS